jgi:hypothetical protein
MHSLCTHFAHTVHSHRPVAARPLYEALSNVFDEPYVEPSFGNPAGMGGGMGGGTVGAPNPNIAAPQAHQATMGDMDWAASAAAPPDQLSTQVGVPGQPPTQTGGETYAL